MKRAAGVLVAFLFAAGAAIGVLVWQLQAPTFRVPAAKDWVFRDVILAEAGRTLRPGSTVRVADGRITDIETSGAASPGTQAGPGEAADLAGLYLAPGSSLHGELAELEAAGIPGEDVWEIATREAGRSLGVDGLGTLDVGAPADLIFLRDDPSNGVSSLRQIEAVLADGRLYRRADLDAMLATADAHFRGDFYTRVMGALVAAVQGHFAPDREPAPSSESSL